MNSEELKLSGLLRQNRPAPALPPRFQQNVWRRIEDAEDVAPPETWLDALAALVLRPRFAVPAAAIVLVAGVLAGTLDGRQAARHEAQMNYVASVAPPSTR